MALTAAEISDLIKERIANFDVGVEARTEGTVVTLTDGIARIHGLSDVMQGEMIEFPATLLDWRSTSSAIPWARSYLVTTSIFPRATPSSARDAFSKCPSAVDCWGGW